MMGILSVMFRYVGGIFKSPLIWVGVIGAVLSFSAGMYINGKINAGSLLECELGRERAIVEQVQQTVNKYEQQAKHNALLISRLHDEKRQIEDEKRLVEKRIDNVKDNADCDIPGNIVGMLNIARTGNKNSVRLSETPDRADEASRTSEAVKQRVELGAHADCGFKYRELAKKHEKLIDWINSVSQE